MNKDELIKLMDKFGSAKGIAEATGKKYQTVYYHLKKHQIPSSPKARARKIMESYSQNELIVKYRAVGGSTRKLAGEMGVSSETIRKYLPTSVLAENLIVKSPSNEQFFNQDNELSFYWAGFIAADGCVKLKDKKYKQLSVTLAAKDRSHVEKFSQDIEFGGKLFHSDEKSEITISSDDIFDSLTRFNVVPRKTLTYTFPEWLKDHLLVHHFIRGYFDGDGSVGLYKEGKRPTKQCRFSFLGTESFLADLRQTLQENKAVTTSGYLGPRKGTQIYRLEFGGNGQSSSFREWLYKDSTICLKRKKDIFFSP